MTLVKQGKMTKKEVEEIVDDTSSINDQLHTPEQDIIVIDSDSDSLDIEYYDNIKKHYQYYAKTNMAWPQLLSLKTLLSQKPEFVCTSIPCYIQKNVCFQ